MPTMTPAQRLRTIAQHYLNDAAALNLAKDLGKRRRQAMPIIKAIIDRFIQGQIDLKTMTHELNLHLRDPQYDNWGATNFWSMTLNKLALNYPPGVEQELREHLDGINHQNVAIRFEHFSAYMRALNQELERGKQAAPGFMPYLLTLLARWLDPVNDILVTWPSLREGLKILIDHQALPLTDNLRLTNDEVQISTHTDYQAAQAAIDQIAATVPALARSSDFWSERFLSWLTQQQQYLVGWLEGVTMSFPDEPLVALAPERLQSQIDLIRKHLLIDRETIQRIYQALVLGYNVILSGPPGTGKTQLASLLPRILWMDETVQTMNPSLFSATVSPIQHELSTITSYAVQIATATDEWTPRHVIGGIEPVLANDEQLRYAMTYGVLTSAILANWQLDLNNPRTWQQAQRHRVQRSWRGQTEEYRGVWLVIDEFNRAPIDLALGEALTAIGGGQSSLTVPTRLGPQPLPIPQDFRIIGTLNSFDRHFLNQMSEALKRRFVFVEVLPPTRQERAAEQASVLKIVLERLPKVAWADLSSVIQIVEGTDQPWVVQWQNAGVLEQLFDEGWRLFEVIRLYRQFGTAQAIAWSSAFLGAGLLQNIPTNDEPAWRACLAAAFADSLADQLQILFPDELEVLLVYLQTSDANAFAQQYREILGKLISIKRRTAQLLALHSVRDADGKPYLEQSLIASLVEQNLSQLETINLTAIFQTDQSRAALPAFEQRLRQFLLERAI
ncbi:MAG: AAA family ATPase [Chloroflexi bacterium]|nr:AAA family ATPase [Chloroflexota bacterium]